MADISVVKANNVEYNIKDATARSDIGTLSGSVSTLQSGLSTTNGNVSTLQSDLSTTNGNVSTLQSDLSTANGNVSSLQTTVGNLMSDVSTLSSGLSTANTNISNLTAQLGQLYVVSGNIEYTQGETILAKVQRAVAQNVIPTGKPFIGMFSSGSKFFCTGYLYEQSNALYGVVIVGSYDHVVAYNVSAGTYTQTTIH